MFVERDENGQVKGLYACLQPGYAEEELAEDHPDVVDFKARIDAAMEAIKNRPDPVAELQAKVAALEALLEEKSVFSKGEMDAQISTVDMVAEKV